jgi:hypothetical protein
VGTVAINGQPAMDGTVVTVCSEKDRILLGETTTSAGHYSLVTQGWTGRPEIFRVSNSDAHQTVKLDHPGAINRLNLTVGTTTNQASIPDLVPSLVDRVEGEVTSLGSNLLSIWNHDNLTQIWNWYDPRQEFAAYNTLSRMREGSVYLVRLKDSQAAVLNGRQQGLFQGWSFVRWARDISSPSCPAIAIERAVSPMTNKDNLLRVWGFDPARQLVGPDFGWLLYDPRPVFAVANNISELTPDLGYWVNVSLRQTADVGAQEWNLYPGWNLELWDTCG